jgi:NADH:ubiquinone oxidoreductase subunit H
MPALYDLLRQLLGGTLPDSVLMLLAIAIPCLIIFGVIQGVAGISTYIERKVAADIQRRVGPNKCNIGSLLGEFARAAARNGRDPRAGFGGKLMGLAIGPLVPLLDMADKIALKLAPGLMIFLADGIKLVLKEDIIPDAVDRPLFKLAPTIVLASALGALAVLPYSDAWYVADFNIGLFYIAAITSMEVLGILMAGWASNNKWALLGGMRSAAQIVSYELPVGLAIATGILISGSMSMQGIIYDQFGFAPQGGAMSSGWFWQWNLFHPAMFILAPVYFLAALAECNRTPFDIPEAESELVSGYHTEYSGMRFAFFFMAEYAMMCVVCAIAVTLFFGGWSTGIAPLENALMAAAPVLNEQGQLLKAPVFHWYGTLVHLGVFGVKTYGLVFVMMWIRWTLPRYRVDQMMTLCWKKLIPLGLLCFFLVAVWMLARMALVKHYGEESVRASTFVLRAVFAVAVTGWLVWFFKKPLSPEQVAQREMLAKAV